MAAKKKEDSLSIEDKLKAALVPHDQQPYPIPENWVWTRMGEITRIVGGGTPRSHDLALYEDGAIPWIRPVDLSGYDDMYISQGSQNITEAGLRSSSARLIPKNSLLFSSRAPIGYVAIAANDVTTSQGFKSFLPTSALVPQYGYWYLKSAKPLAESLASGTTFQEISGSKAAMIPIPLPPLPEQQRIAEKLESLLGNIKEARALLDDIPEILQNFRQTVLATACSGRLTQDWRKEKPDIEPASISLKRLQKEREIFYQEECLNARKERRRKPKVPEIFEVPTAKKLDDSAANLPPGWTSTAFINMCVLQRGFDLPVQSRSEGRYPIASSGGIIDYHSEYKVFGPGVVIGRSGSIGKAFYIEDNYWPLNTSLYVKDFNGNNPKFVYYFLSNFNFLPYSSSTAVPTLNRNKLFNEAVIIPPVIEQREIVRRVESLFSKADDLEARYKEAMELIESLPENILSKAFRGELLPQDPNDEPALELLKRTISLKELFEGTKAISKERRPDKVIKKKIRKDVGAEAKRPLLEVVLETKEHLTPEILFRKAGYTFDEIDDIESFYAELSKDVRERRIEIIRPKKTDDFFIKRTS
jgi:type I restriction enzyme S subunit